MRKVGIGKSFIHGKGVFLTQDVAKDEPILLFRGQVIMNTTGRWFHMPNGLQVGNVKWLLPRKGSVEERINHSCSPSAGVSGKNRIVAMRPMKKGEEVTIDYALSETYPLWHMRCRCKAKNCRKVVKPYQDLPASRMKKYAAYTSRYILDMKLHMNWQEYLAVEKRPGRPAVQR